MKIIKKMTALWITLFVVLMPALASEIHEAAQKGDLDKVNELLAKNYSLVEARITDGEDSSMNGKTALHIAAEFGHKNITALLLENKANINAKTSLGFTPLHFAAMQGKKEVAELLIAKKCILDMKNTFNITPIFLAAAQGHIEIVELLLANGIDMNEKGNNGMTLLHAAALGGSIAASLKLLDLGMPIDARNTFGKTPLHFAAAAGHKGLVELLVAKKADMNVKSLDGKTPLHAAEDNGYTTIVEFLKARGAAATPKKYPVLTGKYLGQKAPGIVPEIFAPGIVSTDGAELGGTFSPAGNEFYFTRSGGEKRLKTNTIMVTKLENGFWTEPQIADFSGKYFDFEPFISPDGSKLYFGSMRALDGSTRQDSLHQWFLEKTPTGWTEPRPMGSPFVDEIVIYPSAARDGTIYFSGKDGIYVSGYINGKYQAPERLPEDTINLFSLTAHPFVAPDEGYLLFDATPYGMQPDIFVSFRQKDGSWTRARKMGIEINTPEAEICPAISPDGRYLFFTRSKDIYWVDAGIIHQLTPLRENN
ncbi:MAG: ankyrin repeat domain-containing protein [Candidatus Aminicenantes bacterium]|nr:ankyrin repeat domain-containing protein [Candidatus Aminicenantes bacterium]